MIFEDMTLAMLSFGKITLWHALNVREGFQSLILILILTLEE